MTRIVPCMGGWCSRRDECAHHIAEPIPGLTPAERLCAPGFDDPELIRGRRFDSWLAGTSKEKFEAWIRVQNQDQEPSKDTQQPRPRAVLDEEGTK